MLHCVNLYTKTVCTLFGSGSANLVSLCLLLCFVCSLVVIIYVYGFHKLWILFIVLKGLVCLKNFCVNSTSYIINYSGRHLLDLTGICNRKCQRLGKRNGWCFCRDTYKGAKRLRKGSLQYPVLLVENSMLVVSFILVIA